MTLAEIGKIAVFLASLHLGVAAVVGVWRANYKIDIWPSKCPGNIAQCPAKVLHFISATAHMLGILGALWGMTAAAIILL